MINAQLWFNEQTRRTYANIEDNVIREQLKEVHIQTIVERLKYLPVGEEYYLQSGYITSTGGAHCVYVAFCKKANDQILIRLDNRWVQSGRIDGRLHQTKMKDGSEIISPYCVGIVDITNPNLKKYIKGLLDALFESDPKIAMEKIYDEANAIPQPKGLSFIKDWPFQDRQSGNANNCTMSSHNFGVMCRQGIIFADWLCNQENSLIWQDVDNSKFSIPQIPTIQNSISSARSSAFGNINYRGRQSQNVLLSKSTRTNTFVDSVSQTANIADLPTHKQLVQKLAICLKVDYSEVYNGIVVEQMLVNMASISTPQTNAMFRRNPDGTTYFILYLTNANKEQLVAYYNNKFPGFIINVEVGINSSIKLIVDTQYLFNSIAPALGNYLKAKQQEKCSIQ